MPTITFDLTVFLQALDDGTTLGEALFFPEAQVLASTRQRVRDRLAAAARRTLAELPLAELARRAHGRAPEIARVALEVSPPRRHAAWVDPVAIELPYAHWKHGRDAAVAVVPALGIQVLAEDPAALPDLVRREVQLALSRTGAAASLAELAFATRGVALTAETVTVSASVKSPREVAREETTEATADPVLPQVATDLCALDPKRAHRVEGPLARLAELLGANPPRSVLIVGRSGVGKTALVGELVRRRASVGLAHTPFWATTGARLVAGMTGYGMWQERCVAAIREAAKARAVLHVGNLMELAEVGRSDMNAQGIASFLKPYLSRAELTAIAECTPEQLAALERADPHLASVWTVLELAEPSPADARVILDEAAARGVRLGRAAADAAALDAIERLHRRYATYSAWPGRPLRFLEGLTAGRAAPLDERAVVEAFATETGLPLSIVDDARVMNLDDVRAFFDARVMGQPAAVELVSRMLATVKARLTRPRRPIASLLFIGPTGVGKTETARALAQYLFGDAARLTRFDMSEYADPLSAQRLVGITGAAEGLLTARVREQPFSVVLLDEFEKADPSLLDLLLQVLGDGRLTDAAGRVADFSSAVVILTSNLGAEAWMRGGAGFATGDDAGARAEAHFVEAVRSAVRPELFNRIDRVVPFLPLSRDVVRRVARRELDLALRRDGLAYRRTSIAVSEAALDRLAADGYEPRYGARPLKRALERAVLAPLAAALVRISEESPVVVSVGVADGAVAVDVRPAPALALEVTDDSELVQAAQMFRRDLQRLERGRAMTQVANELYMLARSEAKARRGKKRPYDAARAKRLAQLREVEKLVASLRARAVDVEDAALLAVYAARDGDLPRGPAADAALTRAAVLDIMRDALIALRTLTHPSPDAVTLAIIGDHQEDQRRLAEAWRQVAVSFGYRFELLAVQPVKDRYQAVEVKDPAKFLAAQQDGVVALVVTVRGPAAGLRFENETGVHRFRHKEGHETGVEVRRASLPYEVPPFIERRGQVPASGDKRRVYDLGARRVEDAVSPGSMFWSPNTLSVLLVFAMDRALSGLMDP